MAYSAGVREAFVEHFFAHAGVAGTYVEDLVGRGDMLGDDVSNSGPALVPVKGLGIPRIALFPVLRLAVLRQLLYVTRCCRASPVVSLLVSTDFSLCALVACRACEAGLRLAASPRLN